MSRDSAVSPVVGVMLLLVLVIIFTAVLAAYAGGLAQTPNYAPSVDIAAYSSGSGDNFFLVFEHRGGTALSTADIRITTFVDGHENSFTVYDIANNESTSWRPGEILSTKDRTAWLLNISNETLSEYLNRSTPLELRLYHLPTNAIIFKDTILLEET